MRVHGRTGRPSGVSRMHLGSSLEELSDGFDDNHEAGPVVSPRGPGNMEAKVGLGWVQQRRQCESGSCSADSRLLLDGCFLTFLIKEPVVRPKGLHSSACASK